LNNYIVSGNGVIQKLNFDAEELKRSFTTVFENGVTKFIVPVDGTYVVNTSISLASGGTVSGDCNIRLVVQPASSVNQVLRHSHDFVPAPSARKTNEGFNKLIALYQGDKFWIEVIFNANADLGVYGGTSSAPKSTLNCYKVAK